MPNQSALGGTEAAWAIFDLRRSDLKTFRTLFANFADSLYGRPSHFETSIFDFGGDAEAVQRFGIPLITQQLYHNSNNLSTVFQACTLRTSGYLGGCSNVSVLWFTQTNQSQIARFDLNTFAGRFTAPNTARSYSIPTSCGSGGQVVITEVHNDGSSCTAQYSGNLPHNRPCDQCSGGAGAGVTVVSSANFRGSVARNSLVSLFPDPGQSFTDQAAYAPSLPLPTSLAGVTVEVEGQLCGLVAVTASQINLFLPPWLDSGPSEVTAIVRTTRGTAAQYIGRPQLNPSAPGIFTLASNGNGPAALNWLVVKPNGQQIWQTSLSYNAADQVFLVLYGTGINELSAEARLSVGAFPSVYCGNSWMPGVQQLVFPIPISSLAGWPSLVSGFVRVGGPGFSFDSQGFDIRK